MRKITCIRVAALILALILACGIFAGCAGSGNGDGVTARLTKALLCRNRRAFLWHGNSESSPVLKIFRRGLW